MKARIIDPKYLFENIENGDFLGFWHKPRYFLFSRLIYFVTGNKLDHIGGVFDVKKIGRVVSFKLGEQTITGRTVKQYTVVRFIDGHVAIDSRFKKKYLDTYLLKNRRTLSEEDNDKLREYWSKKENYKISELFYTVNWFYKLFGKKGKTYDNNCSTAARQSMVEIGITPVKYDDPAPNPTEFSKFSYIKEILKIKII